ncbi:MAG: shikimate dehydrogenase [Lautropia sp.]|nr:shikimate dehydrogenase [Lautropia sp.]
MTDTVSPPSADADRYLVVGNPIAHSRSPAIHAAFARQTGQNIRYERRLIDKEPATAFAEVMRHFFIEEGGRGANVTLPFKEAAFALADEHSDRARLAGAANTLSFVDGQVLADNTDGAGIVWDIQRQGVSLEGRSVTVLGAGGAARGLMLSLLQAGVRRLVVANRNVARASTLASDLNPALAALGFSASIEAVALGDAPAADVVINATSAGLHAEGLQLPPALLSDCRLAYDCVYADEPTPFMQQAAAAQVPVVSDGLGMLVGQAAESFRIWRGVMPDAGVVLDELRASVGN